MKNFFYIFVFFIIASSAYPDTLNTFSNNQLPIPPQQAFQVNATLESSTNQIKVNFNIMPGFYIYKERLSFTSAEAALFSESMIRLPTGLQMNIFNGEGFAEEPVLTGKFDVIVPILNHKDNLSLLISLQGCDGKTICYPPQKYTFNFDKEDSNSLKNTFKQIYSGSFDNSDNEINLFELFIIFFIAGFAISLTPCMYPLYPIALTAITQNNTKKSNIIMLSLAYIHGIALIYILMGVIAAFSGKLLITVIQTPLFVLLTSGIILLLGLSMFDLFEIKLPNRLQNYINDKSTNLVGGRYLSVFILGIFSSLLLGPCITPPLIIAIGFIASKGNVLSGILCLYGISLGMGLPILVLATLGNKLMPKSGGWMNIIKHGLGLVIIALAIYLAYPILGLCNQYLSIAVLCFITALAFLLIKHLRQFDFDLLVHKLMPILLIILGLIFIVIGDRYTVSQGMSNVQQSQALTLDKLHEQINASDKPVLIIVSAKWCSICRELEATTFKDKLVQDKFKQYEVIELDITDNQKDYADFLNQYKLYGPPAIIVLDKNKKLQNKITGYITGEDLVKKLNTNI